MTYKEGCWNKICGAAVCFALFAMSAYEPATARAEYSPMLKTEETYGVLEANRLDNILEKYFANISFYDPERATVMGLHDNDGKLTQRNAERVRDEIKELDTLLTQVRQISRNEMSAADSADAVILEDILQTDIFNLNNLQMCTKRPQYYLEPLKIIYQMMIKDYDNVVQRGDNAVKRMNAMPEILGQAEKNLDNPPAEWIHLATSTISAFQENNMKQFLEAFKGYTYNAPFTRINSYNAAVMKLKKALDDYSVFLNTLAADEKNPLRPGFGDYQFGFYLERFYLTDLTTGGARKLAGKYFSDAGDNLVKNAKNIDTMLAYSKGWYGVLNSIQRTHPDLTEQDDYSVTGRRPKSDNSEFFQLFKDEGDRAFDHFDLHKIMDYPDQRLTYKEKPDFLTLDSDDVSYDPPFDLDSERVSTLFIAVPTQELRLVKDNLEPLDRYMSEHYNYALIELAIAGNIMPGLHMRNYESSKALSRIRRISRQPDITQGWAYYSEQLADENGFFTEYYARFMRSYLMYERAAMSYADAYYNTGKWTKEEALAFFADKLHADKEQAENYFLRITLKPTEYFAAMYGWDQILQMKKYYMRKDAKTFDERTFHALLMEQGDIPLQIIKSEVDRQRKEIRKRYK